MKKPIYEAEFLLRYDDVNEAQSEFRKAMEMYCVFLETRVKVLEIFVRRVKGAK